MRQPIMAINGLVFCPEHARVESQLATLQAEARHTLRGLLPQLTLPERLATTDELGRLGDTVPHLVSVEMVLPAHQGGQATISIAGDDLTARGAIAGGFAVGGGYRLFPKRSVCLRSKLGWEPAAAASRHSEPQRHCRSNNHHYAEQLRRSWEWQWE